MISSSDIVILLNAGASYGGGQSTGSSCISGSPGCISCVPRSSSDSFTSLSKSTTAGGLFAFGGNGGGLTGEGVICVWTTTESGEGKGGVFSLERFLKSWGSAGEGVWCKVMLSACWASVLDWLWCCRFVLTSGGEAGCSGSRRTGLS